MEDATILYRIPIETKQRQLQAFGSKSHFCTPSIIPEFNRMLKIPHLLNLLAWYLACFTAKIAKKFHYCWLNCLMKMLLVKGYRNE